MTARVMYKPVEKQIENWAIATSQAPEMPTDEQFKAMVKNKSGRGWGIKKRDWIVSEMKRTTEYQMGIWQGRVDVLQGLDYQEKEENSAYNLGYYRGYTNFNSDWKGLDPASKERLLTYEVKNNG